MTTLEIKTKMPLFILLDSLKQLGEDELGEVASTAVRLRANRRANTLPEVETTLLEQINQTLSLKKQQRLNELIEKRQAETLNDSEFVVSGAFTLLAAMKNEAGAGHDH